MTALMIATVYRYYDIAKLLLEHGADVNAINKHGYTAFKCATQGGEIAVVGLLKKAGAKN